MLSLARTDPSRILSQGTHAGLDWMVLHNCRGYRCGYVRLPSGHPWNGMDYGRIDADVHGGVTYAEADEDGESYWIGFDAVHGGDAPDFSLPMPASLREIMERFPITYHQVVRTTPYMEAECRRLCEQAAINPSVRYPDEDSGEETE